MKRLLYFIFACIISVVTYASTYDELVNAGKSAWDDKNYERAKYFYEQALAQAPNDSIVQKFEVCSLLRNLCMFNLPLYEESVNYGKTALSIMKKHGGGVTPGLAEEYNMIANAYSLMGNKTDCFCYLDSAKQCLTLPSCKLAEKVGGYWTIGASYSHFDDWEKSSEMYLMAVDELRKVPLSESLLKSLNLYANSLYKEGKHSEAKTVYNERLNLTGQLCGKESDEYRWAYYNWANILAFAGEIEAGGDCYMEVASKYKDVLTEQLRVIPSEKRQAYLGGAIEIIYNMVPFGIAANFNEDRFTEVAYNGLLLTKGLLLTSDRETSEIIQIYGNDEDKGKLQRLKELQHKITDLEADAKSDPTVIVSYYNEIKKLDDEIAKSCAEYGNISTFASLGYADVKSRLKENDILLDFTDFKPRSKPRQYVCFEIRKNQQYPKIRYICNGAEIDSILNLEHGKWSNLYTGEAVRDLNRIIGEPIKRIIGNCENVYYVPSGVIHKLAIEAISDGDTRLGDIYAFHRLSSARELIRETDCNLDGVAQLYGGLTYASDVKPLPRSLEEITAIATTLGEFLSPKVYSGNNGTKASFLEKERKSPSIVHFSTHGFYYSPDDMNLPISLKGYSDAMTLSGLVMSKGSMTSHSELLTADEIAQCNLSNTSIACLASCHSGQGDVTPEGIYGLQRAFKKAGAGSVIINLWEASDVATKCFMTSFYEDLFKGSKNKHKAFEYAKNKVREQYSSPYYWAGFVMID